MMRSTDPRFILKSLKKLAGEYYFANHKEKKIRNGFFNNDTYLLNGKGTLIDYNNFITIVSGEFINDVSQNTYTVITSHPPYRKYSTEYGIKFFCDGIQKVLGDNNYNEKKIQIQIFLQNIICDEYSKKYNTAVYNANIVSEIPYDYFVCSKYNTLQELLDSCDKN